MKIQKIEKDIPIPEVNSGVQFPWPLMKVGDSVFVEAEKGEDLTKLIRTVGPSARYYGEKTGKKFRTLLERHNNGIRVWRIA
jgi:hypothetical protein